MIQSLIISILMLIILTVLLLLVVDRYSQSTWFCRILSWHNTPKEITFNGSSLSGTCPRCNKKVLQDSQGGWF